MGCGSVSHNVVKLVDAQALTVSGGATPSYTSTWFPVEGWVEKAVTVDVDVASGTPDVNIDILVSPYDYVTMRAATASTENYSTVSVKDAQTATVLTRYDSTDVPELATPMRSIAVKVTNDSGAVAVSSVTVWVEGQS